MAELKECKVCKESKALKAYGLHKFPLRAAVTCKACILKHAEECWAEAEKVGAFFVCTECDQAKHYKEYTRMAVRPNGYNNMCKACNNKRQNKRYHKMKQAFNYIKAAGLPIPEEQPQVVEQPKRSRLIIVPEAPPSPMRFALAQ